MQDHIPYKLKNGKKINFAMSTRDYYIEIDMMKIQRLYDKEKSKLEEDYEMITKFKGQKSENIDNDKMCKQKRTKWDKDVRDFVVKNKLQDYVGWKDPIHYNSVQPYYAYTDEDLSLTEWHNIIVKDKLKEIELC